MTDVPRQVLELAWQRLWEPGTPYYLPTAILHGARGEGASGDGVNGESAGRGDANVEPLGSLELADIGPIPLLDSDTWGRLSIEFHNPTIGGLETISDGGITISDGGLSVPDGGVGGPPTSGSFTATVSIARAIFHGDYAVAGSGVSGHALESASSLLRAVSAKADAVTAVAEEIGEDGDLDLARSYRDQLLASPEGLDHVASYYDNNETLNEIVTGTNAFVSAWPNATPAGKGKNSAYFARQTSSAARSPSDPSTTVGDEDYRLHSYYMQGVMLRVLLAHKREPGDKYDLAAQAVVGFEKETLASKAPQGAVTVSSVMAALGSTPPQVEQGAPANSPAARPPDGSSPAREIAARAAALVEEEFPHWEAQAALERARIEGERAQSSTSLSGEFSDRFTIGTITISGAVELVGIPPHARPRVTLTALESQIPRIEVALSGSGGLLAAVQGTVANAAWLQDLLTERVRERLTRPDLRSWLSDRVSQSLEQALGSPHE